MVTTGRLGKLNLLSRPLRRSPKGGEFDPERGHPLFLRISRTALKTIEKYRSKMHYKRFRGVDGPFWWCFQLFIFDQLGFFSGILIQNK
jgi:hypothetical protein